MASAGSEGELCLLLKFKLREYLSPILTVRARVVHVSAEENGERQVGRPLDDWGDHSEYADLEITAQADEHNILFYGASVEYRRPFTVGLERAEQMVRTLRKVDRGIRRRREQFGREESFAGYLTWVGAILKIRTFCWELGRGPEATHYHFSGAGGLESKLAAELEALSAA